MIKKIHYIFLALSAITILIFCAETSPYFVLKYYSAEIYPYISTILRAITGVFPFALGDIIYIVTILLLVRAVFVFFKRLRNKTLNKTVAWATPFWFFNTILCFVILFKLLWGLNYSRPEINTQLGITDTKYSVNELAQLGGFLILKLNALKPDRSVYYSTLKLEKEAVRSYQVLEKVNPLFRYSNPAVKPALNSWLITKLGIEGYYNPFSGEANVNMKLPQFVLPFTICHEIAHQVGVAREDEANLIAYLTAINSTDVNFRYAAYYEVLRSVLFELGLKSPEKFKKLYALLPAQVLADLHAEKAFWGRYNSQMYAYMESALDSYLKLNKQEQGINSYQNIVLWVYNFHKEELLQLTVNN